MDESWKWCSIYYVEFEIWSYFSSQFVLGKRNGKDIWFTLVVSSLAGKNELDLSVNFRSHLWLMLKWTDGILFVNRHRFMEIVFGSLISSAFTYASLFWIFFTILRNNWGVQHVGPFWVSPIFSSSAWVKYSRYARTSENLKSATFLHTCV